MPTISQAARIVRETRAKARPILSVWNEDAEIAVPDSVRDINSFRHWVESKDVPEKHKIWWLQGEVWIDMSREQLYTHVRLKVHTSGVLSLLVDETDQGVFFGDGAHLTNLPTDISGNPDGVYVSHEAFRTGRVTKTAGKKRGYIELVGIPDMALEIMSDSSVKKDTRRLHDAYAVAGIREYWLIDARTDPLRFDIFRLTSKGYAASRKLEGWIKSPVFGRSFRLTETRDPSGDPKYRLEVR